MSGLHSQADILGLGIEVREVPCVDVGSRNLSVSLAWEGKLLEGIMGDEAQNFI